MRPMRVYKEVQYTPCNVIQSIKWEHIIFRLRIGRPKSYYIFFQSSAVNMSNIYNTLLCPSSVTYTVLPLYL